MATRGFMRPVRPSQSLAFVIGPDPRPRTEVMKDIWKYIREKELQEPSDRRLINADDPLRAVFGKDQVTMFEMAKILSRHLTPAQS